MSNGFLRFFVQIARDWTDFWGFDGISGVYLTFLGVMNGERKLRRRMATWRSLLLLATLQNVLLRVLNHFLDRKGYLEVRLWHKGTSSSNALHISNCPSYEGVLITCFCNTQFVLHMQILHEHRCGFSEKKPSKKRIFTTKMTRTQLLVFS